MSKPVLQKIGSLEVATVKIALVERGWNLRDLAGACGLAHRTLRIEAALGYPSQPCRWKVEKSLEMPIFRDRSEYEMRFRVIRRLGFDPWLTPFHALAKQAPVFKVKGWGSEKTKAGLVAAFVRHVLKRRSKKGNPTEPQSCSPSEPQN